METPPSQRRCPGGHFFEASAPHPYCPGCRSCSLEQPCEICRAWQPTPAGGSPRPRGRAGKSGRRGRGGARAKARPKPSENTSGIPTSVESSLGFVSAVSTRTWAVVKQFVSLDPDLSLTHPPPSVLSVDVGEGLASVPVTTVTRGQGGGLLSQFVVGGQVAQHFLGNVKQASHVVSADASVGGLLPVRSTPEGVGVGDRPPAVLFAPGVPCIPDVAPRVVKASSTPSTTVQHLLPGPVVSDASASLAPAGFYSGVSTGVKTYSSSSIPCASSPGFPMVGASAAAFGFAGARCSPCGACFTGPTGFGPAVGQSGWSWSGWEWRSLGSTGSFYAPPQPPTAYGQSWGFSQQGAFPAAPPPPQGGMGFQPGYAPPAFLPAAMGPPLHPPPSRSRKRSRSRPASAAGSVRQRPRDARAAGRAALARAPILEFESTSNFRCPVSTPTLQQVPGSCGPAPAVPQGLSIAPIVPSGRSRSLSPPRTPPRRATLMEVDSAGASPSDERDVLRGSPGCSNFTETRDEDRVGEFTDSDLESLDSSGLDSEGPSDVSQSRPRDADPVPPEVSASFRTLRAEVMKLLGDGVCPRPSTDSAVPERTSLLQSMLPPLASASSASSSCV
ncbi:flocculation protein FLO11-like [Mizuhopecten yessoensis]|uniref:flocculation protein FLO11-like n=1 Tax=Mizuhopecten yessoensis TaxID=6573 RepID=UPI000B45B6AE|nr:flocculation protein FLO11-like [Mizuhopecten yessoensis]